MEETLLIYLICFLLAAIGNSWMIAGLFMAANHEDKDLNRGWILKPVNTRIKRVLGPYWSKPFFGCYACMASIWAGLPFLAFHVGVIIYLDLHWVTFVGSVASTVAYTSAVSFLASGFYRSVYP